MLIQNCIIKTSSITKVTLVIMLFCLHICVYNRSWVTFQNIDPSLNILFNMNQQFVNFVN